MNPGPLNRSRSGVGGVAWQSHQQPLCCASARRGGEGDWKSEGVATSSTSRPPERKRPGWEEEAEEKGVGEGQGPEPGRGGAGA